MLSRLDAEHDVLVGQHSGYGIHWRWSDWLKETSDSLQPLLTAARERLSKQDDVRPNVLVVTGKQFAGSTQALSAYVDQLEPRGRGRSAHGLDFVTDQ